MNTFDSLRSLSMTGLLLLTSASSALLSMDHQSEEKKIQVYKSAYNIKQHKIDTTNLYAQLAMLNDTERPAMQEFIAKINPLVMDELEKLLELENPEDMIAGLKQILVAIAKAAKELSINEIQKRAILIEYRKVMVQVLKHALKEGKTINEVIASDLQPKKKTIVDRYGFVRQQRSKL